MFPVNNTALAQYLGNKQNVWATYMRQATNDTWSSDRELAIKYVIERSAEQLAEEFKQDDAFGSHKICEFMNNSTDQDVTHIAVAAGAYILDASVGAAANITLSALRLACASRQTQNWALPILAAGAVLVGLIAIFSGGNDKS